MSSTLAATVIATAVGTAAHFFGITKQIWPAHPHFAVLLITVVIGVVVKRFWNADAGRKAT